MALDHDHSRSAHHRPAQQVDLINELPAAPVRDLLVFHGSDSERDEEVLVPTKLAAAEENSYSELPEVRR